MSDSDSEDHATQQTQQTTPKKRTRFAVLIESDDDAAATPPQIQRVGRRLYKGGPERQPVQTDWRDRPLFKGRSARNALGQQVAVTYVTDTDAGLRETFIGKVVNVNSSQGLRVEFESDNSEEWVNADEGDEWEWLAEIESSTASAGAGPSGGIEPEEFTVSRILGERTDRHGVTQYLVKWEGYDDEENTWEPKEHLADAPDKLTEFEAKWKRKQEKKERQKKEEREQRLKEMQEREKRRDERLDKRKLPSSESDSDEEKPHKKAERRESVDTKTKEPRESEDTKKKDVDRKEADKKKGQDRKDEKTREKFIQGGEGEKRREERKRTEGKTEGRQTKGRKNKGGEAEGGKDGAGPARQDPRDDQGARGDSFRRQAEERGTWAYEAE